MGGTTPHSSRFQGHFDMHQWQCKCDGWSKHSKKHPARRSPDAQRITTIWAPVKPILTIPSSTISGSNTDLVFTLQASDINATVVTDVTVTTSGSGYKIGDTFTVPNIPGSSTDLIFTLKDDDIKYLVDTYISKMNKLTHLNLNLNNNNISDKGYNTLLN